MIRKAAAALATTVLAGSAFALANTTANAHTSRAPLPVATVASSTRLTVDAVSPWTTTGALTVKATQVRASQGANCITSEVSGRRDAYRCFSGHGVYDPAFKSPTSTKVAFLDMSGRWTVISGIGSFARKTTPVEANIWRVKLANGAVCQGSTGSFSKGPARFPYAVGYCTGGAYGSKYVIWRAPKDDGRNQLYPLLALNSAKTSWGIAVDGRISFPRATLAQY